jgi:hypothetical protein
MQTRILQLLIIGLWLCSCDSSQQPASADSVPDSDNGTAEMAVLLQGLVENGSPLDHYHWNRQLAALFKMKMQDRNDPKRRSYWYDYCYQLLNSGDSEACAKEIERFISARDLAYKDLATDDGKRILELLGLAYLRLGEQQNCQANHTPFSCILPLDEKAFHTVQRGSKKAVKIYTILQETHPSDKNKWLLNLAHMTLGQHPAQVPEEFLIPYPNWTLETDEFKAFPEIASFLGLNVDALCGGVCLDDFNNDGHIDVFATSYGMLDQVQLFINDGDGGYVNRTAASGLTGIVSGLNCLHADYNNDGNKDILVLRGGWLQRGGNHPNSLLKNNGDGTFSDVTKASGLMSFHPTQTAAWADINLDGHLDLFIGNETTGDLVHPCELYVSQGDGTFVEQSTDHGLADIKIFSKGTCFGDINNDGWPDLFVSVMGGMNRLYKNNEGQFQEIGVDAGIQEPKYSFPCWFWDVNNDGFEDIFVSGYDTRELDKLAADFARELQGLEVSTSKPRLYINNGDETFSDQSEAYHVNKTMYSMGANFGDLDNDGFLDFYVGTGAPDFSTVVPNRMFRNTDGQRFEEVTSAGMFGHIQKGHGIGFADMDRDGDQDIYAVMGGALEGDNFPNVLFENPGTENNWIVLELIGEESNTSAIGARIELLLEDDRKIYHTIGTGGSFGASSLQAELGLGSSEVVKSITITWPGQNTQVFEQLEINRKYQLIEGNNAHTVIDYEPTPFKLGHYEHSHHSM